MERRNDISNLLAIYIRNTRGNIRYYNMAAKLPNQKNKQWHTATSRIS